jgi:hydrogenase maturation protease
VRAGDPQSRSLYLLRHPLPRAHGRSLLSSPEVVVIGIGNALRGDDAAGLKLAARLREEPGIAIRAHDGEAIDLLELWRGARAVVLIDAVRSGAAAGTVHRIDAGAEPLPLTLRRASSHTIGIGEAIELARTLGGLPVRVIVYGVEGARFGAGEKLSDAVAGAIDSLADAVISEARSLRDSPPSGSR